MAILATGNTHVKVDVSSLCNTDSRNQNICTFWHPWMGWFTWMLCAEAREGQERTNVCLLDCHHHIGIVYSEGHRLWFGLVKCVGHFAFIPYWYPANIVINAKLDLLMVQYEHTRYHIRRWLVVFNVDIQYSAQQCCNHATALCSLLW